MRAALSEGRWVKTQRPQRRPRTNGLDGGPARRRLVRARDRRGSESRVDFCMWLWCNVSSAMCTGRGRAELPRLPVIPSPGQGGYFSGTAKQHAGSITLATTPPRQGSDSTAAARVLRPGSSRRRTVGQCADMPVAQPVVEPCEQFSCRGNLGDVRAAAAPSVCDRLRFSCPRDGC